jgi:PEP-CTERM motif
MRMFKKAMVLSASAFALASGPAQAAAIVVNHVLNPANIGPSILQENLTTPFTAGVGDTITFNLTFTGGQSVTLAGDTLLWLVSLTNSGSATLNTTGTFEFFGTGGPLLPGPIAFTQDNSFIHVGSSINDFQYRSGAGPITFSGIRQILTIDSVSLIDDDDDGIFDVPSVDPREYYSIALYTNGRVGAVPEPATWAMMIGGFGAIGGAMRYRRRRTSVSFG